MQNMILDYLGQCWYLIVLGETRRSIEQLRIYYGRDCEQLSLTDDIFIPKTDFQGSSYISQISNKPPESPKKGSDCLQVRQPANINRIILSVDRIGVRRVQFLESDSNASTDRSPWYAILDVKQSLSKIDFSFDACLPVLVHVY